MLPLQDVHAAQGSEGPGLRPDRRLAAIVRKPGFAESRAGSVTGSGMATIPTTPPTLPDAGGPGPKTDRRAPRPPALPGFAESRAGSVDGSGMSTIPIDLVLAMRRA